MPSEDQIFCLGCQGTQEGWLIKSNEWANETNLLFGPSICKQVQHKRQEFSDDARKIKQNTNLFCHSAVPGPIF